MKTQQFGALKGTKKLENTPEGIRTPNPRFRRSDREHSEPAQFSVKTLEKQGFLLKYWL